MYRKYQGISPVIGIILMVSVTVGLVAVSATIFTNSASDVSEPAQASLNSEIKDGEMILTVVKNKNLESVEVRDDKGDTVSSKSLGDGSTGTLTVDTSSDKSDSYTVVGEVENGNEQILRTIEDEGTGTTEDETGCSDLLRCTDADTLITVNEVGEPDSTKQENELTSLTLEDPKVTVALKNPTLAGESSDQFSVVGAGLRSPPGTTQGGSDNGAYVFSSDGIVEFTMGAGLNSGADEDLPFFRSTNDLEHIKVPEGTTKLAVSTE